MPDTYIEKLIDSIETYDQRYKPPYFILFYIPAHGRHNPIYFAVLAAMMEPTEAMIDDVLFETKKQVGNMIYAADYLIMKKEEAIDQLESILE